MDALLFAASLSRQSLPSGLPKPSPHKPSQQQLGMMSSFIISSSPSATIPPVNTPRSRKPSTKAHSSMKVIYVTSQQHTTLLNAAKKRKERVHELMATLLRNDPVQSPPRSSSTPSGICLVDTASLRDFFPYLHCPTHLVLLVPKITFPGQSFSLRLECNKGCRFHLSGSPFYPSPGNKFSPKMSTCKVANQLVFALTMLNSSYGEYDRFCKALAVPPLCQTYFENARTFFLKESSSIWATQETLIQHFAQRIEDRHLQMDGSYCQRRKAEHCFVTLLTEGYKFVVLSSVGSRSKLHTSSQGLELELCTYAVDGILDSPLKPLSITHDEHRGVTAMLAEKREKLGSCALHHDGWHRLRHIAKMLPFELEKANILRSAIPDLVRKVLMMVNSTFYTPRREDTDFLRKIREIPLFLDEKEDVLQAVTQFLGHYFSDNMVSIYLSNHNTAALEGFHGHHHRFVGKERYFRLYSERTHLHALMWNDARLRDYVAKNPGVQLPPDLLSNGGWLRKAQQMTSLVVAATPRKARKVPKNKGEKRKKSQENVFNDLLSQQPNPWT